MELPWFDSNDQTLPLIRPHDEASGFLTHRGIGAGLRMPERLIMLQMHTGLDDLQSRFPMRREGFDLPTFLGPRPVYLIDGLRPVAIVPCALGAPAAIDALEVACAMGSRQLFVAGLCGGVGENVSVGDFVVPGEVIREEGVSYHYAPPDAVAAPDEQRQRDLELFLGRQRAMQVRVGTTVSTDAVYRQTLGKVKAWQQAGVLAVDMELSALFTVAKALGMTSCGMMVVSDKHNVRTRVWRWGGAILERSRPLALELMVQFARTVN